MTSPLIYILFPFPQVNISSEFTLVNFTGTMGYDLASNIVLDRVVILEETCPTIGNNHGIMTEGLEPLVLANVNVEIFVLYIFSHYSRFQNMRENRNIVKIFFFMPYIVNNIKNVNINPRNSQFLEIREYVYTRKYLR